MGKDPVELESPVLFNLEQDPGEQFDVAKEHPEVLAAIKRLKIEHEKTLELMTGSNYTK